MSDTEPTTAELDTDAPAADQLDADTAPPADAPPADEQPPVAGNREARYRIERNQAREERDFTVDLLDQTRRAVVAAEFARAGVDPRLVAAAGVSVDELIGMDGLPDYQAISAAAERARTEFGLSRAMKPNRAQLHAGASQPVGGGGLTDVFRAPVGKR